MEISSLSAAVNNLHKVKYLEGLLSVGIFQDEKMENFQVGPRYHHRFKSTI